MSTYLSSINEEIERIQLIKKMLKKQIVVNKELYLLSTERVVDLYCKAA